MQEAMQIRRSGSFLVTVVAVKKGLQINKPWLQLILETYIRNDDVFRWEFLSGIIFTGASESEVELTNGAHEFLKSMGNEWIEWAEKGAQQLQISLGPCAFLDGEFSSIFRLFDDSTKAFLVTLKPPVQGLVAPLSIPLRDANWIFSIFYDLGMTGQDYQTLSVALPSRLSFATDPSKPLNGWRIAVKDNFLLDGLRTSLCNKAYYDTYPPATRTAACIERLITAGAVIVGKTKLSSMVSTEEPTQGIDFQTAWNPRADGYQSPAGSSSGSGAAMGAYSWLDIAIGSDSMYFLGYRSSECL